MIKQHVAVRNAAYPQCFEAVPPGPTPSPSPNPPPAPAPSGNWSDPVLIPAKLPYTSATITVRWVLGSVRTGCCAWHCDPTRHRPVAGVCRGEGRRCLQATGSHVPTLPAAPQPCALPCRAGPRAQSCPCSATTQPRRRRPKASASRHAASRCSGKQRAGGARWFC